MMFKKLKSSPIFWAILPVLLTVLFMILLYVLAAYVSEYFVLAIPILWVISFTKNFKDNSEYRREIGSYISSGYNIVHREGSFKYGDYFAADEVNGYLLKILVIILIQSTILKKKFIFIDEERRKIKWIETIFINL